MSSRSIFIPWAGVKQWVMKFTVSHSQLNLHRSALIISLNIHQKLIYPVDKCSKRDILVNPILLLELQFTEFWNSDIL